MTKFENVGRRDGPGTGGKARKDVSILPPARLASRPVHGKASVTSTTFSAPAESPWPTGSENSASNAAATTSPRRPFTPPRSHRSHADGDSPIRQALPACSKTPTACRHASGATTPALGDPSPRASSSISSAHRLHNHCVGAARSVDPSAGNGRIVLASKTTPQIPAVSLRTAITRACGSIQQMSPRKVQA
jgi:hypothetical protein